MQDIRPCSASFPANLVLSDSVSPVKLDVCCYVTVSYFISTIYFLRVVVGFNFPKKSSHQFPKTGDNQLLTSFKII